MARGWESKAVEAQIESAESRITTKVAQINAAEAERIRERESLLLHRTRVTHDIEASQNPRYREILRAALKHLDDKLAQIP